MTIDCSSACELNPQVALRPEPFGALAYHYGNRRLVFLRSAEMVAVVRSLSEHACVADALDAAGIDGSRREPFIEALASLESSEIVRVR